MAAAAGLVTYTEGDVTRGAVHGAHLSVPATIQSCPIAANVTRGFKEVARLTPQEQKWFDEEWGREDARRGTTQTLDEPVKFMDHAMDAARYALTSLKAYAVASAWPGAERGPGRGAAARPDWL